MTTIVPAYGRDYQSKAEAIADLEAGKDFLICDVSHTFDGKYCSIRDFAKGERLKVRYKKLRKVFIYVK